MFVPGIPLGIIGAFTFIGSIVIIALIWSSISDAISDVVAKTKKKSRVFW